MRLQPTKPEPRYNLEPIEFDQYSDRIRFIFSELLKNSRLNRTPKRCRLVMHSMRNLVEPTGIEPVTSCLQSRRSPS